MILFLVLQVFSQIDSSIAASRNGQNETAYRIAHSVPLDSLKGFDYYEVLELRGLMSLRTQRFKKAKKIYNEVIQCNYDTILYKAYINLADVYYYTFDFEKRIEYLQKAHQKAVVLEKTYDKDYRSKVIRNIARHHFQIRADYETAQIWIDRHPTDVEIEDQAGFAILQAEFFESKRQYSQAIDYYTKAKISAQKANLFSYELFAAEGVYRAQSILDQEKDQKFDYIQLIALLIATMYMLYWYANIEYFPQTPD